MWRPGRPEAASSTEDALSRDLSLWLLVFGPLAEVLLVTLLHCQPTFPLFSTLCRKMSLPAAHANEVGRYVAPSWGPMISLHIGESFCMADIFVSPPSLIELIVYFPQCGPMDIYLESGVTARWGFMSFFKPFGRGATPSLASASTPRVLRRLCVDDFLHCKHLRVPQARAAAPEPSSQGRRLLGSPSSFLTSTELGTQT